MPFPISPVAMPFATPIIAESHQAAHHPTDAEPNPRRQPHHDPSQTVSEDPAVLPVDDTTFEPTIGTLVDVRG